MATFSDNNVESSGTVAISGFLASRIADSRKRPRVATPRNRRLCPHCKKMLILKTYRRHESLFCRDGVWVVNEDDGASCTDTEGCVFLTNHSKFIDVLLISYMQLAVHHHHDYHHLLVMQ